MLSEKQLETLKMMYQRKQFDKVTKILLECEPDHEVIFAIENHAKSLNLLCTTSDQLEMLGHLSKKTPEHLRTRETERRLKMLIADLLRKRYGTESTTSETQAGGQDQERSDQVSNG